MKRLPPVRAILPAGSAVWLKSRLALYLARGSDLATDQARLRAGAFLAGAFAAVRLAGALAGLVFTAALDFASGRSSDFLSAAIRSTTFEPRLGAPSSASSMIFLPLAFFLRSIRSLSAST